MKTIPVPVARTVVLALLTCLIGMESPQAQTPSGSPPPTYDYDATVPGTQPPKSPLVAGYDYRSVRTYQVTIPVLVPLAQLQAIMPAGFSALPSAPGANTATLSLAFFLDQRFERTSVNQSYGPVSALLVSTTARNDIAGRNEIVFPAFEASGEIAALNASFGPGSARLADVKVAVEQQNGMMRFSFDINDPGLGFKIRAEAESPAAINNRTMSDPVLLPFRTFNGRTPNNAFWAASQSDTLAVPTAAANVKLHATGNRLRFPAGTLSIVGLGPTVTFSRNVEFILKFE